MRPALSMPRDDLRTQSEAADRPQRVRGGKAHERRGDGAEDHPLNNGGKLASLCGSSASTVSPRRSRTKPLPHCLGHIPRLASVRIGTRPVVSANSEKTAVHRRSQALPTVRPAACNV